jgi:hypothetical protein
LAAVRKADPDGKSSQLLRDLAVEFLTDATLKAWQHRRRVRQAQQAHCRLRRGRVASGKSESTYGILRGLAMDQRYMVKQYVAVVQNKRGSRFMVFETGDSRWYLFSELYPGPTLIATGLQFPVREKSPRRHSPSLAKLVLGK